eukprot:2811059-Prymnesium_polylepis.1
MPRYGKPTPPLLPGWSASTQHDPLAPPSVRATSSASFEVVPPVDPAWRCRAAAGLSIEWSVQVRQPPGRRPSGEQALDGQQDPFEGNAAASAASGWHTVRAVRAPAPALGMHRAGDGTAQGEVGATAPILVPSLRCPAGCHFRMRAINVVGWEEDAAGAQLCPCLLLSRLLKRRCSLSPLRMRR